MLISYRTKPREDVKIDLKKIQNVLILRNDGLGDYVLTTPIISVLKKMNPSINIDVIASHRNAPLIEQDYNVRRVFRTGHRSRFLEFLNIYKEICKYSNYDLMIAAKHTKITNTALLFNLISRKALKIGFKIASVNNEFIINSYKLTFNNILRNSNLKYSQLQKETLQTISSEVLPFGDAYLLNEKFTIENKKTNKSKGVLKILVNISGFEKTRIFNEEYIKSIKKVIQEINTNIELTFISSPQLYPKLDKLASEGLLSPNEIRKYDLLELIKELPKFDAVITPDTAISHFASVLNIPQIIFYDKLSNFLEWCPDNDNYLALVGNGDINDIDCNEFKEAANLLILQ